MQLKDETRVYITPTEVRGSDVVDTKGKELLRNKFTTEHQDLRGILVFVDLEPGMEWPHFCRWVWVDNRGWTKQMDHMWPPSAELAMVATASGNIE